MNIESFSTGDSEFRNRFGGKNQRIQTKWEIAEQTAFGAASFFRDFTPFTSSKSAASYRDDLDKRKFRENFRYYAVYLGLFLLAVVIFAIYSLSGFSTSLKETIQDDYTLDEFVSNSHSSGLIKSLKDGHAALRHHSWRQKIFDLRPTDVINHKYDDFAISIILADDPTENHLLHTSFKTFLRQISRLQICTETSANAFIGSNHHSNIIFSPKSELFPKLERYIDGFLSMNVFAPNQSWYIQVDEGNIIIFSF